MLFNLFRKKTVVHLYTILWNEENMLEYFFRYYDPVVDKYIFFDDGSTDATLEILSKHPKAEIRSLPRLEVDSYVLAAKEIHDNCWKESRGKADWVIITAIDEFLYTSNLRSYLSDCKAKKITAIPALGFQMISRTLPVAGENLIKTVTRGCPFAPINKLSIFDPDKIQETNYHVGRHVAEPIGEVKYPDKDILFNLHYKCLSFEDTFKRHNDLQNKLGTVDKQNQWGIHYSWAKDRFKTEWDYFEQNSVDNIFSNKDKLTVQHSLLAERWWHKYEI